MALNRFTGIDDDKHADGPSSQKMNVLALVKDTGERYVFLYDDIHESRVQLLRVLGRYASDPDLSFQWYDAAVLSQKIRKMANKQAEEARRDDEFGEGLELE